MIRAYFHAEAERELDEAAVFYEFRVPGLGKSFLRRSNELFAFSGNIPTQAHLPEPGDAGFWLIGFHTLWRMNGMMTPSSSSRSDTKGDSRVIGAGASFEQNGFG